MRADPSVEMIATSLRSCGIGRGEGAGSPAVVAEEEKVPEVMSDESGGGDDGRGGGRGAVEVEQRLDSHTGEVCCVDRDTGKRSLRDPRIGAGGDGNDACCSSSGDSCSGVGGRGDDDDREGSVDSGAAASSDSSCITSASSTSETTTVPAEPRDGGSVCDRCCQVLVAAGCRSCFMYFMVPKNVDACPKCGDHLLHLGRHGRA